MALAFKTTLDDSGFEKGLKRMEMSANQTATVISTKMRNAMSATGKKEAGMGNGGHGGSRGIGDAINALSGGSGAVGELSAIQGALAATAGVAVSVYAAAKAFEELHESVAEARKAVEQGNAAFGRMNSTIVEQGPAAIEKEIEANTKLQESLKETRNWKLKLIDLFTLGNRGATSEKVEQKLQERSIELQHEGVAKIKERTAAIRESTGLSERDLRLAESKKKLDEESSKIEGPFSASLNEQAKASYEARNKIINHEEDAKDRAYELEKRIFDIKKKGGETDMEVIQERMKVANADVGRAINPDEKKKAILDLKQIQEDEREANDKVKQEKIKNHEHIQSIIFKQMDKERQERIDIEKEIADKRDQLAQAVLQRDLQRAKELDSEIKNRESERQKKVSALRDNPHHYRASEKHEAYLQRQAEHKYDRQNHITPERRQEMNREEAQNKNQIQKMESKISEQSITRLVNEIGKLIVK